MKSGIYEIVNLVNGKRYIGSAVNFVSRWNQHKKLLRTNKHCNRHLQRAWNKHGASIFGFNVIELVQDKTKLFEREQYYLDNHKPEYNLAPVAKGARGLKWTAEQKLEKSKWRAAFIANSPEERERLRQLGADHRKNKTGIFSEVNRAYMKSPEFIKKMRAATAESLARPETKAKRAATMKRLHENPEYRAKRSAAMKKLWENPEYRAKHAASMKVARKPMTPEQCQAISERQRGRAMHPNAIAALLVANKGRKDSPARIAARAQRLREWWTPERKAERAKKMREYHANRKKKAKLVQAA